MTAVNNEKSSPKFARYFGTGDVNHAYCCHAEMLLMERIDPCRDKEISVARFTRTGQPTMARPCRFCQKFLQSRGIRRVNYTNWQGDWEKMLL